MAKLNQIIAIEKGIKSRVMAGLTDLNKLVQKPDLFNGLSRVYQKKDEDGEDLPPERKRVQHVASAVLSSAAGLLTELMDVTARKDWTNCLATADIVVDDKIIIKAAPVPYLLFLEKSLTDLRTFVGNLPILDDAETWTMDIGSGLRRSEMTSTHRTKKVQRPIVLYPATTEHPAQTQLITEDVIVGHWQATRQSGAMAKTEKEAILTRIEKLLRAVKEAREAANGIDEVKTESVGDAIFAYILD